MYSFTGKKLKFLGALSWLSVGAAWKNSAPTVRIFMKFYISLFFRKSVEKIQASLTSGKKNGFFT